MPTSLDSKGTCAVDANKLIKLKEIGYTIRQTCGNCDWAWINDDSQWGECCRSENNYDHLKHNEKNKMMSINRSGWCPLFKLSDYDMAQLKGWEDLIEK